MILYGSSISPFVRKVMVFAAEKGIALEVRSTRSRAGETDPAFLAASPAGKMPALVDGEYALADSSAIVQYLEAVQPEPNLIPTEPRARGRAIWFDEWADTLMGGCGGKIFYNRVVAPRFFGREGDLEAANVAEREELPRWMDYLEAEVPASGFLIEDRLTLADIAVVSPVVNLMHMDIALDRWPRTMEYVRSILKRPSFAEPIEQERALLAPQAA